MGNDVSQKGQQCHCDCNDGHTSGDFDDLCTDTDKLMCMIIQVMMCFRHETFSMDDQTITFSLYMWEASLLIFITNSLSNRLCPTVFQ